MTQTTPSNSERTCEAPITTSASPAPVFDWRKHRDLLATCEMTEAQEKEFLDILWSIAVSYVDLTLGLHPAQLATGDYDIEPVIKTLVEDWSKTNGADEEVK